MQITVTIDGSYCWKWEVIHNSKAYFGWERTEEDAIAEANWVAEKLQNGEEVDLE